MSLTKHFWEAALEDYEPLALPYDRRPASSTRTGHGSSVKLELGGGELLLEFARQTQMTPFQVCMSVYYIFLYKLTQSQDLIVGSLVANRPRHELAQMIGMFANLVPYRLRIEPQETFRQLITRVAQMSTLVTAHAQLPYQHIVQQYYHNTTMKAHTLPYISTGLQFESPTSKIDLTEACELLRYPTSPHVAKYDLWLSIEFDVTEEQKITGSFDYACDVFDQATVVKIARRFEYLLTQLFTTSSSISQMSLILSDEIDLLHQLNTGDVLLQLMHPLPIHYQFLLRVQEHPQKVALILDNQSLTYAELLHYTQLLAVHLIDECHVKSGDTVGLCVERSIEVAIAMLGILLSGATYLPFWPDLPIERLHSLIKMTQPHCILIHSATHHLIPSNGVPVDAAISNLNAKPTIERFPSVNTSIDNTAVILFTSGSTGMSKAVPLSHQNLTQLIDSLSQLHLTRPDDIIIQLASCSFDVHAYECMSSFILGATLVLLRPQGNIDTRYLCQTIAKSQATTIFFVPTSISILCEYLNSSVEFDCTNLLATLKCISTGGKT
jgi:non-ribosomal peptide synthetase component F